MSDPGPVVTDSGPLIALATVGQMDLLGKVFGTILVPDAVFREVAWYGARRPGADELAAATWAIRVDLEVPPEALLAEDVGPGESEAIALAVQRRACCCSMIAARGVSPRSPTTCASRGSPASWSQRKEAD